MLRVLIWLVDALLTILVAGVIVIIVSGGFTFTAWGNHVSARSAGNPLVAIALLTALRYRLRTAGPFLGLRSLDISRIEDRLIAAFSRLKNTLQSFSPVRASRLVLAIACVALLLKIALAITNPGFFSGDDVEIHEMTLGHLFGLDWPAWNVRSAFFPMVFIYPVQALLAAVHVTDTPAFVAAGRVVVAVLSTLALPVLYRIVKREDGIPVALLAVGFLATSRLHIAFGSAELPRPVATVFVLGAFLCLMTRGLGRAILGARSSAPEPPCGSASSSFWCRRRAASRRTPRPRPVPVCDRVWRDRCRDSGRE